MNTENTFWVFIIIFITVIMGIFAFSSSYSTSNFAEDAKNLPSKSIGAGEAQIVKLRTQGSNYVLEPSTVKKGIPVRLEADMNKMPGCAKGVVISAFNIRKSFTSTDNSVEFTPDKAGTFNIACSMNMYRGTFSVSDSNGTEEAYVEPAATDGGSCGSGSSGCGCGRGA